MSEEVRYGGQAVIEGVMMRGRKYFAVACRRLNGEITLQKEPVPSYLQGHGWQRWPLIRGVVSLVDAMVLGMKTLIFSADLAMQDIDASEPGATAKDGAKPSSGKSVSGVAVPISMFLGVALAVLIFKFIPLAATTGLSKVYHTGGMANNVIDSLIRMGIFIGYITVISQLKDVRRVFQYHGAEHKTIHAYEAHDPLTVENVRKYTTRHQRCGTTFILMVLVIQMMLLLFTPWEWSFLTKLGVRLAMLLPVAAISFEIIRMAGKNKDSKFWNTVIAPGLWLQGLTTKEPDDSQIEVAIASLNGVLEQEAEAEKEAPTPEATDNVIS